MSVQDLKWIAIASSLLVSVSLWVGAHSPVPNPSSARMASRLGSAPPAASARSLTGFRRAVVPATGDSWHSPAELARLKARAARLDKEEQDLAKPVPYDGSHGFDAQRLAANAPQIGGINPSGPVDTRPDPSGVGYDFNSQMRDASTGDATPSEGDASTGDQSAGDRYFNPYDPANYYPPGYTPSGNGPPGGGSDNDNSSDADGSSGSSGGS